MDGCVYVCVYVCARERESLCGSEKKATEHIIVILSQHESAYFSILSHRTLNATGTTH